MRINLTKKDIINSICMQTGFSKRISENLLEDIFEIILKFWSNNKIGIIPFNTSPSNTKAAYFLPNILITLDVPGFPLPDDEISRFFKLATIYAKLIEPIR